MKLHPNIYGLKKLDFDEEIIPAAGLFVPTKAKETKEVIKTVIPKQKPVKGALF